MSKDERGPNIPDHIRRMALGAIGATPMQKVMVPINPSATLSEASSFEELCQELEATIRRLEAEKAALREALDRRIRPEMETVRAIAISSADDFAKLDRWWPKSKRGSNAENALASLLERIGTIQQCAEAALTALRQARGETE